MAVKDLHDELVQEQARAWALFDENDACSICGAQVREFEQVLHIRWHTYVDSFVGRQPQ